MEKPLIIGVSAGAVALVGALALGYGLMNKAPSYADVIGVTPITETVVTPKEVCKDVAVTHRKPVKDEHQIAGSAIGAIAGGVLGNQVGGGSGKKIATVAGAIGGGYAGNKIQENMQENDTYTTTETRCNTIEDKHEETVGYKVEYVIDGKVSSVDLEQKPNGTKIPLGDDGAILVSGQI